MPFGTQVKFEPEREVAFGSVTGSFTAVGTPTIGHSRIVSFTNGTNADVYVSFDGVTVHLRVAANSFKLFDFSTNKIRDDGFFIAENTTFYVKFASGAPSSGTFWIEVAYGAGGV